MSENKKIRIQCSGECNRVISGFKNREKREFNGLFYCITCYNNMNRKEFESPPSTSSSNMNLIQNSMISVSISRTKISQ